MEPCLHYQNWHLFSLDKLTPCFLLLFDLVILKRFFYPVAGICIPLHMLEPRARGGGCTHISLPMASKNQESGQPFVESKNKLGGGHPDKFTQLDTLVHNITKRPLSSGNSGKVRLSFRRVQGAHGHAPPKQKKRTCMPRSAQKETLWQERQYFVAASSVPPALVPFLRVSVF